MDEYNRLYKIYINKADDELNKIVMNDGNEYTETAVEVAKEVLQARRMYGENENIEKEPTMSERNNGKVVEVLQKIGVLILLVTIYPLGMYFLWKNKKFEKQFKVIESVCCLGLWVLLIGVAINNMQKNELMVSRVEKSSALDTQETTSEQFTTEEGVETQTMTEGRDVNNTEVDLLDEFVKATNWDLSNIPDREGLMEEIYDITNSIGVTDIKDIVLGNLFGNKNSVMTIDGYCVTDTEKQLIVSCQYRARNFIPKWFIIAVVDVDTGNYYYASDYRKYTVDFYDYQTGEKLTEEITIATNESETQSEKYTELISDEAMIDTETKEVEKLEEKYVTGNTKVSELTYMDENIVDTTIADMKQYEYIKDVFIEVDEDKKEIDIVVQIPSSTDMETAKMAGEDVARYLAAMANFANSYYEIPGSESIGGIYNEYDLLIYVDDGKGNYNIYGGKVTTSKKITWRY